MNDALKMKLLGLLETKLEDAKNHVDRSEEKNKLDLNRLKNLEEIYKRIEEFLRLNNKLLEYCRPSIEIDQKEVGIAIRALVVRKIDEILEKNYEETLKEITEKFDFIVINPILRLFKEIIEEEIKTLKKKQNDMLKDIITYF